MRAESNRAQPDYFVVRMRGYDRNRLRRHVQVLLHGKHRAQLSCVPFGLIIAKFQGGELSWRGGRKSAFLAKAVRGGAIDRTSA
jgi:hypothetical protein